MTPRSLGLAFDDWRPKQLDAVFEIASHMPGLVAHSGPTGSGKSLTALGAATLRGGRFAYLTATKGLQDQIRADFPHVVDMRGQANYLCDLEKPAKVTSDQAVCRFGVQCALKGSGCAYFAAYRNASANSMTTNYACWLNAYEHGLGFGAFDTLILDEAHAVPEELSRFYTAEIPDWAFAAYLTREAGVQLRAGELGRGLRPALEETSRVLKQKQVDTLAEMTKRGRQRSILRRLKEIDSLLNTVARMAVICVDPQNWVLQPGTAYEPLRIVPVRPSAQALLRNIPGVLLSSATLTQKTLDLIGLGAVHWTSAVPAYDRKQRPIYLIPTAKMRYGMPESERAVLFTRLDQAIQARKALKGVIHTGSYTLAKEIAERSKHRAYFITHERANAAARIRQFKDMKGPAILVSPAVTTGWNFPGKECEWQIIAKVSWPNPNDPVIAARTKLDANYPGHLAMQSLVQACGRGNRLPTDYCETLVFDDTAERLLRRFRGYAPDWFHEAVERRAALPAPRRR